MVTTAASNISGIFNSKVGKRKNQEVWETLDIESWNGRGENDQWINEYAKNEINFIRNNKIYTVKHVNALNKA